MLLGAIVTSAVDDILQDVLSMSSGIELYSFAWPGLYFKSGTH